MNVVNHRTISSMLLLLLVVSGQAWGQYVSQAYLSSAAANRLGLRAVWNKQVVSHLAYGKISEICQFVSAESNYELHEIQYDGHKTLIREHALDRRGNVLGKEQAAFLAKQTVIALKESGYQPEQVTHHVPEITLYFASSDGVVHAIDAETGRILWRKSVGKPGYPTLRPAANEQSVAVIYGSTLYMLRRTSGEVYWETRLTGVPVAGPAISHRMVFTLAMNGFLEAFHLDELDKEPWRFQSTGRGMGRPRVLASTVSWSTGQGHVYVGDALEGKMKYRLEADGIIQQGPAFVGLRGLVATTTEGLVYGLDRLSGEIEWRTSTGRESYVSPVVIGDRVYVFSEPNGMWQLHGMTGKRQWSVAGITQFIAASAERLYCLDVQQRLRLIDVETGAVVGTTPGHGIEMVMTNWQTDRILLGTKKGRLQYFHEQSLDAPLIHLKPNPSARPAAKLKKATKPKEEIVAEPQDDQPTVRQEDQNAVQPEDDSNPFEFEQEDDNPFGFDDEPSDDNADDNPFG